MNSSMLAGERRWASARRGGMTVLGKVAVPKPINLPSQRLENHGLDPNVEIVPKGTVSWGTRTSSSGSNPWTSSSLSPNADGGAVSPSHLSGGPSSGGSGTRPSTSGSDRTHEPVPNAWGSNSRPSSASGTLSSNQTSSASLRPRSAENRPNSSQLSRFAEPLAKSSAAWGSSVTAERLGVKSSKEDGFSLSTGDFPTLGSEKDNSVKNIESEDHSRPSSASGRLVQAKEDDIKHGTVNTWKADGPRSGEDDIHPSMEKWQGDAHQYFNANAPPQRFDAWRGPPMNGPAGVWYGGRPRGPAFGAHVAPGGFPMEPFPYYRPQIPPPPLAGSQPVPPPGPRGPHPKTGELYRPQMPDAYARPGMPFRPGFYPGPHGPMPFEGYYGPPMGYGNSDRDIPYMGMAAGPPVYNGYPAPAPDISNPHGRAAGRGPAGKKMSEQVEADHLEDTHGPKRVPLKSHNECDQREEGGNWEQNVQPNVSHPGKSRVPLSFRKNEWGAEEEAEEAMLAKRTTPSENSSRSYENRVHSADGVEVRSFDGIGNVRGANDNWTNKSEGVPSFPPAVPLPPIASERDSSLLAANKNSALMHKIDGLNAKFRVSDGRNGSPSAYNKEEERNGSQTVGMKINDSTGEVSNTAGSFERTPVSRDFGSVPHEVIVPVGDNPMHPIALVSRRPYHGGHNRVDNRVDHRGKGKLNSQDADGWRRRPLSSESSSAVTVSINESAPNNHAHGPNIVGDASESPVIDSAGKIEGDLVETYDSTDIQRAKMRELAKQCALQLQKEEEERNREQKAKAFAKLEELNRRTLAGEAANQKAERTQVVGGIRADQESHAVGGPVIAELNLQEPGFNLVSVPFVAAVDKDSNINQAGESVEVSRNFHLEIQQTGSLESNVSALPVDEDTHDSIPKKVPSQFNEGGISRHKRTGYKQKQNNSSQKSLNEKSVSSTASEAQKDHTQVASTDVTSHESPSSDGRLGELNVPHTSETAIEPSAPQRRKISKGSKTKPKLDEAPAVPASPPVISDINHSSESIDDGWSNYSLSNLNSSVSAVTEPDRGAQPQEVCSPLPNEESQSRVSNQWKSHPSRRLPRSQQGHRFTDKHHGSDTFVWAPVRSQNKANDSDEARQNSVQESVNSTKGNNVAQNSSKGKRAEMERYVPKPVAKELAQQGSVPPLSSSVSSSRSNEGSASQQPVSSITAQVRSDVEINEGDGSHNKHKKDHGMWRQRGSTDSSHMKGAHFEPSPMSEPTKDIQQSKELGQSVRSEVNTPNAETKVSSVINTSEGNNMPTNTIPAAASKYPLVKDQGATGRGKRHPHRGPRNSGNNHESENTSSFEVDESSTKSAALDLNQTDRTLGSKENRSFGERASSQWQPKSRPNSANNQHGNRTTGSESVTAEINSIPKKDHPQHKAQVVPRQNKESGNVSQPQPGQSVNVKSNVTEESVAGHRREFDKEKKPASVKGRPYSPNLDPVGPGETLPISSTGDHQLEGNVSSGSRRTGRQNSRPARGHDSRGDWSLGHDNRPHNVPAFRERQRQNAHNEYQPVGPFKGSKPEKVDEPADGGADGADQRHTERGQSHPRRGGNFYRRQSGAVHVESGRY